jgi:hypothetical protein
MSAPADLFRDEPADRAPGWVYTTEALAANPDAQMPSWAAFIAIQAEPLDAQNPLGFLDKSKS